MNLVERLLGGIKEQRKRVVVIGDVLLDRWVRGYTAPSQDGCRKFVQESVVSVPGGAANAERSISGWGIKTWCYGYAVNDCPVKARYVEDGEIVFRHDDDHPPSLAWRGPAYEWCRRDALEMVGQADAVLLSDYDKGFLTTPYIREVVDLCRKRGIPCVADCKREPEVYKGCVLKCNEDYASHHKIGHLCGDQIVTHGANQPFFDYDEKPLKLAKVKCVNHVGAGDCFAAHLTLALAYDFTLKEAAAIAHSAGRVYVQYEHNRPPLPTEIAADMSTAT